MVYLEIIKEWSPILVLYNTSPPLLQVENPEDPGKGHWFYISYVLLFSQSPAVPVAT